MNLKNYFAYSKLFIFAVLFFSQMLGAAPEKDSIDQLISKEKNTSKKLILFEETLDQIKHQNFEKSIQLANQAIALADQTKHFATKGNLLRLKGNAYYFKGKYDSCSIYFYQSLKILTKEDSPKNLLLLHNDFGRLYRKLKDYPRALQNYESAFLIEKQLNDDELLATLYNESGIVYEEMGNYEEAINRYQRSLTIQEKRGDLVGQGYALEFIGGAYLLQKEYSKSEDYLQKALTIREKTKDQFAIALNLNVLGNLYFEQKNLKKAESYYLKSNSISQKIQYKDLLKSNYQQLAQLYKSAGKYDLAYENLEQYRLINDEIFNIERLKQVEELSTKYETAEKDKLILEQKSKILKRNVLVYSLAGFLLLGFIYYRNYQNKQKILLQKEIYHQNELATKALFEGEQNERIRIARDLHDSIGQMLSVIKMNLSMQEKSAESTKIQSLVDQTIDEVRAISHNLIPEELNFGIISALENLADKINFSSTTKMELFIPEEIRAVQFQKQNELSIYRIVQEVVNNMVKHADATAISLTMKKVDHSLILNIADNGKGIADPDLTESKGIGWKNINARVNMMDGKIKINSEKLAGTQIEITLPQNE